MRTPCRCANHGGRATRQVNQAGCSSSAAPATSSTGGADKGGTSRWWPVQRRCRRSGHGAASMPLQHLAGLRRSASSLWYICMPCPSLSAMLATSGPSVVPGLCGPRPCLVVSLDGCRWATAAPRCHTGWAHSRQQGCTTLLSLPRRPCAPAPVRSLYGHIRGTTRARVPRLRRAQPPSRRRPRPPLLCSCRRRRPARLIPTSR